MGGTACEFRIYNFLPTSGTIQINLGAILNVQIASTQSSLRLSGINPALYPVQVNGVSGDNKEIRWTGEVDFTKCRKARLLIFTDPYGRVRPRVNTS